MAVGCACVRTVAGQATGSTLRGLSHMPCERDRTIVDIHSVNVLHTQTHAHPLFRIIYWLALQDGDGPPQITTQIDLLPRQRQLLAGMTQPQLLDFFDRQREEGAVIRRMFRGKLLSTPASAYWGVQWFEGQWKSRFEIPGGVDKYGGLFLDEEAAARATDSLNASAWGCGADYW